MGVDIVIGVVVVNVITVSPIACAAHLALSAPSCARMRQGLGLRRQPCELCRHCSSDCAGARARDGE
jgi:hypothetical protein